jgi:tRNA(Ile)-lysidine synthase
MALLRVLVELGVAVTAVHYDHAAREESAHDAAWVNQQCRRLGVPCLRARRQAALGKGSPEAAMRAHRYAYFAEIVSQSGIDTLALGHTANDLVEGMLLNLLRGAGLAGLRGMPYRRGPYVRPLLGVWRAEVLDFLESRGIAYLTDPTNADPTLARVRVRSLLLPALERSRPDITKRLWQVAATARSRQTAVEAAANATLSGRTSSIKELQGLSPSVRAEALRRLFYNAGGRQPGLSRRHLQAADRTVVAGKSGQRISLPDGLILRRLYDRIEVASSGPTPAREHELVVRPCLGCATVSAAHLRPGFRLLLGGRTPGLRMRPGPGGRNRKLQDLLVDAKVPRHLRDQLPLVFADGQLAWVPGIATDVRFAVPPGQDSLHVEVIEARIPL